MKFALLALLGVVSAQEVDAMSALRVNVSRYGQKRISKEATDVFETAEKIKNYPATKTLRFALHKWAKSRAAMRIHRLDKKFIRSPMGKRLIKEWKDVGRVLKKNVYHNSTGFHIPNRAFNKLENELEDVGDQYERIGKSHWAPKYNAAYKKLFTNREFQQVKLAGKNFKQSKAGHMLKDEVMDLRDALKTHVKVSDVPAKWKKQMNGLKISIDEEGQEEIEDEVDDVKETWDEIEDSEVVQNVGKAFQEWGTSDEVEDLKELDKKFYASADGQRLIKEW
jgi:hypothetical protein